MESLVAVSRVAGVLRMVIGLSPFISYALLARITRIPDADGNGTARMFARLFGARDVGLGVLVLWASMAPERLGFAFLLNAAMDGCDIAALVAWWRSGTRTAAGVFLVFATGGMLTWLALAFWLSRS